MITNENFNVILEKYKSLMYHISHRIGGDRVAHDFEDSFQELSMSACDAVVTLMRKTGKSFDELFPTRDADKYIKTCLWNKKNNLGNRIKKKYGIRNCISLSGNVDSFDLEELRESGLEVSALDDVDLDEDCLKASQLVCRDSKLLKPDGSINVSRLSREMGKSKNQVKHILNRLEHAFRDFREEN